MCWNGGIATDVLRDCHFIVVVTCEELKIIKLEFKTYAGEDINLEKKYNVHKKYNVFANET